MVIRALAALLAALAACNPDLPDDTSLVRAPRVLAIASDPAEAAPGATVAFRALWVGPEGTPASTTLDWAYCAEAKPFTEPGPVAPDCLAPSSSALSELGAGLVATGALPANGCKIFGPDPPDPLPGQPPGRPVDPDGTGGYYQPVRIYAPEGSPDLALGEQRIRCGLPTATAAQASTYAMTYRNNTNPSITRAAIERDTGDVALVSLESDPGANATVSSGEEVHLAVDWDAAEAYVWFDPQARALSMRREAITITWYATGGSFASGRTGRTEAEADTTSSGNTWTAPTITGTALLWIVVRDDRGGVTWASYRLAVH